MMQPVDFGGALQRFRDAPADIFCADVALELRLLHQFGGLRSRTAKQERPPRLVQGVREVTNRAEARGVNGGHVSQTQDDNRRKLVEGMKNVCKLVRGAKKEWSMNAINNRVFWNVLALKHVHAAVFDVILGHRAHGCGP